MGKVKDNALINIDLDNIIALTPGNIYWKNARGQFLGCNKNVADILKLKSRQDIIGKTNYDLMSKKLADLAKKNDCEVMDNAKEMTVEEVGYNIDDNPAVYLTTKRPLFDKQEKVIGLLGISIDITDKKRAEQLAKEKEIVEQTVSYLKTMASSMAHELRSPIAKIKQILGGTFQKIAKSIFTLSKATFTKENIPPVEKQLSKSVEEIQACMKSADLALGLMSVQLNNVSSNKIDDSLFTTCSMFTVVDNALRTFFFENNQKQLVNWQNENGQDFEFEGEPILTRHILWNLLKNALRAIEESSKGEITIWFTSDEQYNYLHFKDTAKGIPVDMAARVFDQFYTKSKGGTGLGLSFCQTVMHAYGGDITCTAEEGKYAQFTLKFPKQLSN